MLTEVYLLGEVTKGNNCCEYHQYTCCLRLVCPGVSSATGWCGRRPKRKTWLIISDALYNRAAFGPQYIICVPEGAPTIGFQRLGQRRFDSHPGTDWTTIECPSKPLSTLFIYLPILSAARFVAFSLVVSFQFLTIGFDETYPLWAISSVGSGGLDWTIQEVGQVWDI